MNRAFAATLGALVLGSAAHAQYPMPAYPPMMPPQQQMMMPQQQMMVPQQQMMMPQQQMMMMPQQQMMMMPPVQYVPMGNGQVMPVAAFRQPAVPVMMVPVRVPVQTAPMIAPLDSMSENGPLDPSMLSKASAPAQMHGADEKPAAEKAAAAEPEKKVVKDETVPPLYKKLWPFNRSK